MELETFTYTEDKGWSTISFSDLDSEQTLVLIFASSKMIKNTIQIKELARYYPQSKMIGCSAGEISGASIEDDSLSIGAGEITATALKEEELKGIFVLSKGVGVNGLKLVKMLNNITGGLVKEI